MPNRHPLDHPLVIFKPSRIHGTGGFAWVDLRKGQRIIEYIGPKISKAKGRDEINRGNAYIFTLDEDYDIDGSVAWNPARFLNHSCTPNCESDIVRNGRLRTAYYMATLTAARSNPAIKTFYSRLIAAGKPEKVARCAAARKLLHIAWAVVKKDQPFDPNYAQG